MLCVARELVLDHMVQDIIQTKRSISLKQIEVSLTDLYFVVCLKSFLQFDATVAGSQSSDISVVCNALVKKTCQIHADS